MFRTAVGGDEEQCRRNENKEDTEIMSGSAEDEIRARLGDIDIVLGTAPESAGFEIPQHCSGLFHSSAVENTGFDLVQQGSQERDGGQLFRKGMVDQDHADTEDGQDQDATLDQTVGKRMQGEVEEGKRQIEEDGKSCFMPDYHHAEHCTGGQKVQNPAESLFIRDPESRCKDAQENENDTELDVPHTGRSAGGKQQHHACKKHTDEAQCKAEQRLR